MADAMMMARSDVLRKAEAGEDVPREEVRVLARALMELEVEQQVGAARHERTPERTGQRNGYRERQGGSRGQRSSFLDGIEHQVATFLVKFQLPEGTVAELVARDDRLTGERDEAERDRRVLSARLERSKELSKWGT